MNPFGIGAAVTDALTDSQKGYLDAGYRHLRYPNGTPETVVAYNNLIQKYIEADTSVPAIAATFIADPLGGNGVTYWPSRLGMAATFDPSVAAKYAETLSQEWRALGISMKVAPQIDLATEPRWRRLGSTYGEDPQLAMDFARADVNGWQSTYDEDGNDLGWGKDSVNTQMKHLFGEGAGEGGREAHSVDGAYNVFPGHNLYTHLLPFLAAITLPGKTERSSSAMTNFSIAVDEFGDAIGDGGRVATSFNAWKINEVWRTWVGWDGYILTDFGIWDDGGHIYGTEDYTPEERVLAVMMAGCDAFGSLSDVPRAMRAYELGVQRYGQQVMDDYMRISTIHALDTLFNVGVMDNPYLDLATAKAVPNSAEHKALANDALRRAVVMLKNSDNLIKPAAEKLTVYIPYEFTPATSRAAAKVGPNIDPQTALKFFNVVTDRPGTPTGPADNSGKATYTADDIIRASAEDIAKADFALVRIQNPQNGNPTVSLTKENKVPEDYIYRPISLQYRPYTADNMYVRFTSMGGQRETVEVEGVYGIEYEIQQENRSYFGETGIIKNEYDLDLVEYVASVCDKVVVGVNCSLPMVFSELEPLADAIFVTWSGTRANANLDEALFDIIAGNVEPSALLPMQMPADMETVEAQYEDVPRDMECYVDADGNTYDFAFGLNWSGVINDERVAKYYVEPISVDETTVMEYFPQK
jgi:beta-glucosidase